ncbi:MAG: hypothetical protein U0263_14620 [Polyangiaceae bacterium]
MSTILIVALCVTLVLVGLVFVPVVVGFNLQARGEPSGFWAIAGGAEFGPVAMSAIAARGIEAQVAVHAFGRKVLVRKLTGRKVEPEPEPVPEPAEPVPSALARAEARYQRLARWLDPVDLALFVVGERRRIELLPTVVELEYGFRDIALTGKLLGALYALSAFLPSALELRQRPSWESTDRASLSGSGKIRIWPGRLCVDAAWYLIKSVKIRRRGAVGRGAPEAT